MPKKDAKKKPTVKIDIMLAKAMPGIGPKGMMPMKGVDKMAKKSAPKSGKKGGMGKKPC